MPNFEFIALQGYDDIKGMVELVIAGSPDSYVDATCELLIALIAIVCVHFLLLPFVWKTLPTGKHTMELLDLYIHILSLTGIVLLAGMGTYTTSGDLQDRIYSYNVYTVAYLALYTAKSLVHVPILFLSPNCTWKSFFQYLLHHALSMTSFAIGLYTRRLHYYGCFNGICELSALLLNVVLTYRYLEKPRGVFYAVLGFLVWLSFLLTRIVLFPVWLYQFYVDVYCGTYRHSLSAMELYFYPGSTLILLLLSIIWFIPITKGFVKAIAGAFGGSSATRSNSATEKKAPSPATSYRRRKDD